MAGAGVAETAGDGEGRREKVRDDSLVIGRARSTGGALSERAEVPPGTGEDGREDGRKMEEGRRACIIVCGRVRAGVSNVEQPLVKEEQAYPIEGQREMITIYF